MKSIYASKLFIASKRKEQIKAALLAEANSGLVQQLAEDLDEQYQTPENLGQGNEKPAEDAPQAGEDNEFNDFIVDDNVDPEKDLVTMDDLGKSSGGAHKSASSGPAPKPSGDEPKGEKPESDTSELMPESPANEKPAPALEPEASTQVENKTEVKASTLPDLNMLKGTLNNRKETAGVIRIAEKENEVWIYYNDDINLNDVMVDVIECITCLDTQPLEFNRLARSDNAVVFVIESKSTSEDLDSVNSEENKKKAEESLLNVEEV